MTRKTIKNTLFLPFEITTPIICSISKFFFKEILNYIIKLRKQTIAFIYNSTLYPYFFFVSNERVSLSNKNYEIYASVSSWLAKITLKIYFIYKFVQRNLNISVLSKQLKLIADLFEL